MAAKKKADRPPIDPERAKEIASDARSGTHWADQVDYGPACVCGAFLEGSTITSWGREIEKGECHRHGVIRGSGIAHR